VPGRIVSWFGNTCNTGHANYRLQFLYYNTNNVWAFAQYNIINNNTKYIDPLEVEFATTSR